MAEGTIKRLTDRGFGFIDTGSGKDIFFHSSDLEGVSYEELQVGQRVSYTEGRGPKGPRAENVIKEAKIKEKGKNRRRPSLLKRKNEN
jgi:CspA family cold shock protein